MMTGHRLALDQPRQCHAGEHVANKAMKMRRAGIPRRGDAADGQQVAHDEAGPCQRVPARGVRADEGGSSSVSTSAKKTISMLATECSKPEGEPHRQTHEHIPENAEGDRLSEPGCSLAAAIASAVGPRTPPPASCSLAAQAASAT